MFKLKIKKEHLLIAVAILVSLSVFFIAIYLEKNNNKNNYKPLVESGCAINQKSLDPEDVPQESECLCGCNKKACSIFQNEGFIEYANVHPDVVKQYR